MSSDGMRYPIEPKIAPLVFSFMSLRVCPPVWSCEGHMSPDGTLRRLPQVWFYTRSLVFARLIGDLLAYWHFKKQIANPWHICVSYSESESDTGFSLEPDVKMIDRLVLESLQQDVAVLSALLVSDARAFAQDYLDRYSSTG
ncbi:MAG: hypothetical protein RI101_05720 [Nitrospira sp.]|nr:hypothetical protein [Nitrospira sp.]